MELRGHWVIHMRPAAVLGFVVSATAVCQNYGINTLAGGALPENILGTSASLGPVRSIASDGAGRLFIALPDYFVVLSLDPRTGVLTRVAGNGIPGFSGDNGPATGAQLSVIQGVGVDSTGNVYIADTGNNRIRKVSNGVISTVAGNGNSGFSGDNGPAINAQLKSPGGVAVDSAGNLYIADTLNNRIRKVSDGVISTAAPRRRRLQGPRRATL